MSEPRRGAVRVVCFCLYGFGLGGGGWGGRGGRKGGGGDDERVYALLRGTKNATEMTSLSVLFFVVFCGGHGSLGPPVTLVAVTV